MDLFYSMKVFVQVAEQRSLRGAARTLGMSAASISARMNQLEQQLAVVLLQRTTRAVSLTAEGQDYLLHCQSILGQITDYQYSLRTDQEQPQGQLRVSAPTTLANHLVIPTLGDFLIRYPGITIDLDYSPIAFGHAGRNNSDVLLRMGPLHDSSLIARPLGFDRLLTVASPAYLESAGTPGQPSELSRHRCINIAIPDTGRVAPWVFWRGKRHIELQPRGALIVNAGEGRLQAAIAGLGIAQIPAFQATHELASGRLLRLLPDWETRTPPLFALYDKTQRRSPRICAYVDYLLERFPARQLMTP